MATTTFPISLTPVPTIRVESVGGDLQVTGWDEAKIELSADDLRRDAIQQDGTTITIRIPSDLELRIPHQAHLVIYRVGGDAEIEEVLNVEAATIGGDLEISGAQQVRVDAVGGDADLTLTQGIATIGRIGGDLSLHDAAQLTVGVVGGDADLSGIGTLRGLEKIGGDVSLTEWAGRCEHHFTSKVGGDVTLELTDTASFVLHAELRGDLEGSGTGWNVSGNSGVLDATFGEGGPVWSLNVGGDLEIEGGTMHDQAFSSRGSSGGRREGRNTPANPNWGGFGEEMRGFGREMENVAREMAREFGQMGRDFGREVMRETQRPAEPPRAGDAPPRPGRPRVQVRVNNREFQLDAKQIERIRTEAQRAATAGIARAQEAVMRAFNNMGIPQPTPMCQK